MSIVIPGSPNVTLTFSGYVTGFTFNGRVNDKFTGQVSVKATTLVSGYPAPAA
jgi:hypothetical protein